MPHLTATCVPSASTRVDCPRRETAASTVTAKSRSRRDLRVLIPAHPSELREELPSLFRHPPVCPVRRRRVIANEQAGSRGITRRAAREIEADALIAGGLGPCCLKSTRAQGWVWSLAPVHLHGFACNVSARRLAHRGNVPPRLPSRLLTIGRRVRQNRPESSRGHGAHAVCDQPIRTGDI